MSGNDLDLRDSDNADFGPEFAIAETNSTSPTSPTPGFNISGDEIPPEFTQMGPNSLNCIIAYAILFVIAATGNFSVFFSVLQQLRRTKSSRIGVLILHLSISDLLVTFGHIPLEIIWRITVQWYGGNLLCKICKFFSAFGLYLSSMVLICISLDRYFCILYPLRVSNARRRGKLMLSCAWIAAIICSAPQSMIFHVEVHPIYKSFQQCVTFGFFSTPEEEMIYNIMSLIFMYFLPLAVIFFTYGMILCKISRKSRQQRESRRDLTQASGRILLRRNEALNHMERAKSRTLRLTFVIVLCFVLCWTPYVVITLWYMFDRASAKQLDGKIQDFLFIMAVANSCVNPLIYGTYTRECRESVTTCCGQSKCCETEDTRRQQRLALLRTASRKSTASFRLGTTTAPSTPPVQQGNQDFHFPQSAAAMQRNNSRGVTTRGVKLKLPEDSRVRDRDDPALVVEFSAHTPREESKSNHLRFQPSTTYKPSNVTNIPLTHYNRINLENPIDKQAQTQPCCTAFGKKTTCTSLVYRTNHGAIPGPKV